MATDPLDVQVGKIEAALSDPDAPWYGSDLVPLVADTLAALRAEREDLSVRLRNSEQAFNAIRTDRERLVRRLAKLEAAIRWALGENGEFGWRPAGAGAFWWRKELRERAGYDD